MRSINVGDSYTIGGKTHILSKEIYRDYKKIDIVPEKFFLQCLKYLKAFQKIVHKRKFSKRYFAISGTLLGIIRHEGFIPTDDDFDIVIFRDLHDDILNNRKTYNRYLSPFKIEEALIGFKVVDPAYGIIGDLFVYETYNNHFVPSGPIIKGKPLFLVPDFLPFCKFHTSIVLPIQINAGQLEDLRFNLPSKPEKCIEINYNKEALQRAKILPPHSPFNKNGAMYRRVFRYEKKIISTLFIKKNGAPKSAALLKLFTKILRPGITFARKFDQFGGRGCEGKKICSITVGCYDLLHYGHKELFKFMRNKSDYIVCFIHDNESIKINKNITNLQTLEIRMKHVKPYVNELYPVYSSDPTKYLRDFIEENEYKYDFIYIRGDDWREFPGKKYINEKQIEIIYKPYTKGISSSQIRNTREKSTNDNV